MCNPISTLYPDHLLLQGVYEGYEYEVTRNHSYFRCGYVRIPAGHPWHGKDYGQLDVDVYGGLTFADADVHCGKDGPDDAWWLGFDCGHVLDRPDPDLMDDDAKARQSEMDKLFGILYARGTIRSTEFVVGECERIIHQAIAATKTWRHRLRLPW